MSYGTKTESGRSVGRKVKDVGADAQQCGTIAISGDHAGLNISDGDDGSQEVEE